ncbi:P1 family peptidase [candidate division KSB1 bacterium]|nr:P1 family peptidase [candidate division KSB1 bacterium]
MKKHKQTDFVFLIIILLLLAFANVHPQKRSRDLNIKVGILEPGKYNAITDVNGVLVGHRTVNQNEDVRTGVTVILPHSGNIFQDKVKAAVYVANGFGKLIGSTQIEELGVIETPIALTNTLNVFNVANALIDFTLKQKGNENLGSINPVVGETNDGYLNNIQKRSVTSEHVFEALAKADSGVVLEGSVGAGTGTTCFGFKGGIGTSSRVLPKSKGSYTVGVLVQTNFGGILEINGAPVGRELGKYYMKNDVSPDGSCMIVVATDAPLSNRNLRRLAKRAILGLAKTGGFCSNGSGDYVIAFSTHPACRVSYRSSKTTLQIEELRNSEMSLLFLAVVEATQEAIYNSLFMATDVTGFKKHQIQKIPVDEVVKISKKYKVIN